MEPTISFAIARTRPGSLAELERIPGAHRGRARGLSRRFLDLVAKDHPPLTEVERAALKKERLPDDVRKTRKRREERLLAWRKTEAETRKVNVQVVLPGHVLRKLAAHGAASTADLARVSGLGDFRVLRYGAALLPLLADKEPASDTPSGEGSP